MIDQIIYLSMAAIGVSAFLLGYTAAETLERKALTRSKANYVRIQKAYRELNQWAQTNWPNEFRAYWNGHVDGYQQGVSHSPELEERARMSE